MNRCRPRMRMLTVLALVGSLLSLLMAFGTVESARSRIGEAPRSDLLASRAMSAGTSPGPALFPGTAQDTVVPANPALLTKKLTTSELKKFQPNEIGWIPVLEYHVITTDPARESDQFVRTAEHMRQDLQFLYDHDFHVIPMRELVRNQITAPPGKHPVVLTFDDASASQFRWSKAANGAITIDPTTAIGVLESFFVAHPDFGRGGFFAVLPFNCFADGSPFSTLDDCTDKLTWMANNGYEIGLHTIGHQDLRNVSDDEFQRQIGENVLWLDERVHGSGNMSRVIAMPFGDYPDGVTHQAQRQMMRDGFTYKGVHINLEGALLVGANPTESPSSATFDPIFIARIQAFKASLDQWFPAFANGTTSLYTSDGNPGTVTVPAAIPADLAMQFNASVIIQSGKALIRYDSASGQTGTLPFNGGSLAIGIDHSAVRERSGDLLASCRTWT